MKNSTSVILAIVIIFLLGLGAYLIWSAQTTDQDITIRQTPEEANGTPNTEPDPYDDRARIEESSRTRFEGLQTDIEELQSDIDTIADDMTAQTRLAWETAIAAIELRLMNLEEQIQTLEQTQSRTTWQETRNDVEASLTALEEAYLDAQAEFMTGS